MERPKDASTSALRVAAGADSTSHLNRFPLCQTVKAGVSLMKIETFEEIIDSLFDLITDVHPDWDKVAHAREDFDKLVWDLKHQTKESTPLPEGEGRKEP